VRLKSRVDAKIIGGLIVLMWGVFIDFSIKTRLERLKQTLLAEETPAYGD
jgi:F0F1-type ATP synthase delta subunit